jgi:hypothetical protein
MAKKQTRRSISVSRTTYEKLKAFCETNNISMSQFVETRVGDFLGEGVATPIAPMTPKPMIPARPMSIPPKSETRGMGMTTLSSSVAVVAAPAQPVPMTSAAARFAVEPPPPVIKKQEQPAPKPTEKRPDQIFTF